MKKNNGLLVAAIAGLFGFFFGCIYEDSQLKQRPIPMRELRFDRENECFRFVNPKDQGKNNARTFR